MSGSLQPIFSLIDLICFMAHDDPSICFLGSMNKKTNILNIYISVNKNHTKVKNGEPEISKL